MIFYTSFYRKIKTKTKTKGYPNLKTTSTLKLSMNVKNVMKNFEIK